MNSASFRYGFMLSLRLHAFWLQSGPAADMNQTHFFKNLGMMGGLLMIASYGAGRWALDARTAAAVKEWTLAS